ncbi:MAG: RNA polymerase Rpb4 family protein [Candidatus Methanomethylicia archaeon]|nr:RNA polymerase Rpb4 family protein [Candidatus Methanomethylicia archaeon]MCX8169247.1 RNA polymerase Rpb4 family protein [Candidatus Methanomethylicia archaeon]MDW7988971.1 RNA polymerase Rpb4 family protein [Nitrososphaerota archaeon]
MNIPRQQIEKKEIPYSAVRDLLQKRKLSDENLTDLQNLTLNVVSRLSKISTEKAEALINKLMNEFNISRFTAVQIVNILPKNIDELRTLLVSEEGNRIFLSAELQKMLSIIKSF